MAFYKTATTGISGIYSPTGKLVKATTNIKRNAGSSDHGADHAEETTVKKALNLLSKDVLRAVSSVYNISDDINSYIFVVARAVTADVPNNNGDNFQHDELTRFSPNHRCLVFQTFYNDPLHIEHCADNPKTARGYLPDVHYITSNKEDKYVLTVVAMDTKKDPPLAEGLLKGDVDSFSMGCICEQVRCSACGHVANSDKDLCDCLKWYKMATIKGKLVYEDCLGVEYQELSVVGNPADPKARTQALLKYASRQAAHNNLKASFNVLSTMLDTEDQAEVARYFSLNAGKLPEAMLRLADKLF